MIERIHLRRTANVLPKPLSLDRLPEFVLAVVPEVGSYSFQQELQSGGRRAWQCTQAPFPIA